MTQVCTNIFLGNAFSVRNPSTLRQRGVSHILSVLVDPPSIPDDFGKLAIQVNDYPDEELLCHFSTTNRFIHSALTSGNAVLIHCQQGASRSATVVAAYLMATRKMTTSEALDHLKQRRPVVALNPGFVEQLEIYESCAYDLETERGMQACEEWRLARDRDYATKLADMSV